MADEAIPLEPIADGMHSVFWLRVDFRDCPDELTPVALVDFADRCDSIEDLNALVAVLNQSAVDIGAILGEKFNRLRAERAAAN